MSFSKKHRPRVKYKHVSKKWLQKDKQEEYETLRLDYIFSQAQEPLRCE